MKKTKAITIRATVTPTKPKTNQRCYMRRLPGKFAGKIFYTAFTPDGVINRTVLAGDRLAAKSQIWQIYMFDVQFYR
jgi:hypothetical protein